MISHMKKHERIIKDALASEQKPEALADLLAYHEKQISRMQHERLVHLLVTMFTALFLLLALAYSTLHPSIPAFVLTMIFMVMECFYLFHYYQLENGVQRWYKLADQVEQKIGYIKLV
jgi:hypothetical protein